MNHPQLTRESLKQQLDAASWNVQSNTERYTETHLIEADDANQARAAVERLYRLKCSEPTKPGFGPSYSDHPYDIKKLRTTPFLNASEILARTSCGG